MDRRQKPNKPSGSKNVPHNSIHHSRASALLAQLSKSAELIHERYNRVEQQLDHAIDLVVAHMGSGSQSIIEEELTERDWKTLEEAKKRMAAKKAREREPIKLTHNTRRNISVPNIPKPTEIPAAPWYEDDRFPKPYKMRLLSVTNGFTDIADTYVKFVNTYASLDALVYTNANPPVINPETRLPRYTHKVELGGYTDAQITLKFDEEHVLVFAERPQGPGVNHRETIEVIYLPDGVCADHLKIARDAEGTLFFEERSIPIFLRY